MFDLSYIIQSSLAKLLSLVSEISSYQTLRDSPNNKMRSPITNDTIFDSGSWGRRPEHGGSSCCSRDLSRRHPLSIISQKHDRSEAVTLCRYNKPCVPTAERTRLDDEPRCRRLQPKRRNSLRSKSCCSRNRFLQDVQNMQNMRSPNLT